MRLSLSSPLSLSTSICPSPSSPTSSFSCTSSSTLSSTTWSPCKTCAPPRTRGVTTPTTSTPPSHEVSWRCDVFLLVQRGQGSTNQISDCCWSSFSSEGNSLNSLLGHVLVCFFVCLELCFEAGGDVHNGFLHHLLSESRVAKSHLAHLSATSPECECARCNRASASCRSCLFNKVLWRRSSKLNCVGVGVSTKWNRVACHVGDTLGNTCFFVSEGAVKVESFCRVGQGWPGCLAWSVCALSLAVFLVKWCGSAASYVSKATFALALWLFFRKFFTLSYFSRSRFVHVSDALRFLHVRLFQFRCQWWVHPTPFFGDPRDEVISGSSLWDVLSVSNLKLTSAGASRSVCFTSCSSVQAHQRVVIAAQFVGLRLGNVLGKLRSMSRLVSADLDDVVFQLRRIMRNL